ncbi:MAG: arginine--tRNA ligase [Sphingobacteriales bacterium]|nr:arginine--tRNA ligase [Sphingobacteriales bacterium]
MNIYQEIQQEVCKAFPTLFGSEVESGKITINETPKDFTGDVTLVVFPLLKLTKKNPEESAKVIGDYLVTQKKYVTAFNVIKGFLNLSVDTSYWVDYIVQYDINQAPAEKQQKVLIEYSSPNTNKPLHLGHIRNNVLGYALAGIYKANGYTVIKANLVNDRGIHICKSMLAWKKYGKGETPESTGIKGDKLVGKYYVEFDRHYKQQIEDLTALGNTKDEAEKQAPILLEAQEMLRLWEAGDREVMDLWSTMNSWVYAGFEITYKNLGVDFDKFYYESDTYLLGKDIIEEGIQKNVFYRKEDGSVWIDLTQDGLDHKLVLRADGTSVYITQDLGTADLKYNDFKMDTSIYVVGNEQDYHFKVLKLIMQKLGRPYANGIYHFSYGMVDLPSGKMKSREGTVVDADDLMGDMIVNAREQTEALGKMNDFSEAEKTALFKTIGMGALKFFLLRVDPKKRILFDPKESIDLQGYTGPFVQYTYARTRSILRRNQESGTGNQVMKQPLPAKELLHPTEIELIKMLYRYPIVLEECCKEMNPAQLIDYSYEVAKTYNKFYTDCSILAAEKAEQKNFRILLTERTGDILKKCFSIAGIEVPERM